MVQYRVVPDPSEKWQGLRIRLNQIVVVILDFPTIYLHG
jgi:hypothetical protein